MELREARPDDVGAVADVCKASGRAAWTEGMLVPREDRIVLAAIVGDELAGIAKTHLHPLADGEAPSGHYLGGVVVGPLWRRQGIGDLLTRARIKWIWERSDRAYYFANENNTPSIEMHKAMGFEPIAHMLKIRGVTADDGLSRLVLFELRR